jgi:hypothetical protein
MTCVPLGLVPWTTNTTPGGFDEQRFQKGGLKGALVVVVKVVVVAATTVLPNENFVALGRLLLNQN